MSDPRLHVAGEAAKTGFVYGAGAELCSPMVEQVSDGVISQPVATILVGVLAALVHAFAPPIRQYLHRRLNGAHAQAEDQGPPTP